MHFVMQSIYDPISELGENWRADCTSKACNCSSPYDKAFHSACVAASISPQYATVQCVFGDR